jgi:putative membrane protein
VTARDLPDSTRLALDRTRFAYERTLMAWVRTAVSLISFGFTIDKFFEFERRDNPAAKDSVTGARAFALTMISIGLVALLLATAEHRRGLQAMRAEYGSVPYSLAAVVAALVGVLGVLGLLSVVLRF